MTEQRLCIVKNDVYEFMWVDFSELDEAGMLNMLSESTALGKTLGNHVRILADFSRTRKSKAFNQQMKAHGKEYQRIGIKLKIAVLGIDSPLKRVIVNSTMAITRIKDVRLFGDLEEAEEWLRTS